MKIVVFGATGNTGLRFIEQALAKGHELTAFVRNADSLPLRDGRLRVVLGDTTGDPARVEGAIQGSDVVVSALGRRRTFRSENLMVRSLGAIVPAMGRAGVRRFILVSSFGVGDTRRDASLASRILYRLLLTDIFADKAAAEVPVRASELDWTILYPTMLTDGPLTGRYRVGERLEGLAGLPKISRADVAHFMVGLLESDAWRRKGVVLSY